MTITPRRTGNSGCRIISQSVRNSGSGSRVVAMWGPSSREPGRGTNASVIHWLSTQKEKSPAPGASECQRKNSSPCPSLRKLSSALEARPDSTPESENFRQFLSIPTPCRKRKHGHFVSGRKRNDQKTGQLDINQGSPLGDRLPPILEGGPAFRTSRCLHRRSFPVRRTILQGASPGSSARRRKGLFQPNYLRGCGGLASASD